MYNKFKKSCLPEKKTMTERKVILMCILICSYLQAPLGLAGHFSKYKEASKLTMIDF